MKKIMQIISVFTILALVSCSQGSGSGGDDPGKDDPGTGPYKPNLPAPVGTNEFRNQSFLTDEHDGGIYDTLIQFEDDTYTRWYYSKGKWLLDGKGKYSYNTAQKKLLLGQTAEYDQDKQAWIDQTDQVSALVLEGQTYGDTVRKAWALTYGTAINDSFSKITASILAWFANHPTSVTYTIGSQVSQGGKAGLQLTVLYVYDTSVPWYNQSSGWFEYDSEVASSTGSDCNIERGMFGMEVLNSGSMDFFDDDNTYVLTGVTPSTITMTSMKNANNEVVFNYLKSGDSTNPVITVSRVGEGSVQFTWEPHDDI